MTTQTHDRTAIPPAPPHGALDMLPSVPCPSELVPPCLFCCRYRAIRRSGRCWRCRWSKIGVWLS
jgi:hypothetical protein